MKQLRLPLSVSGLVIGLVCLRLLFPERPENYIGVRALLDAFFAIGLLALTLLLSGATGWKILLMLKIDRASNLEVGLFSLTIGMSILAYGVLGLGVVGILTPGMILLWMLGLAIWTIDQWKMIILKIPGWINALINNWRSLGVPQNAIVFISLIILSLDVLLALAPPIGYDGLIYHLQGPRSFLDAGRIVLLPENWQANGPFTIEMLYTVGMAFGSDVFSQLTHLVYAVCLLLATYSFTRRFQGRRESWIAYAILLGIPLIPYLAALPNVDFSWALYELLAMYGLFIWRETRGKNWLILSGLMVGWALGSKYFALGWAGILGLWVLLESHKDGWKKMFFAGFLFGSLGLLVGSPWYIKNMVLSGNPVYPFIFGGPGWDFPRLNFYMKYAQGFGGGRGLLDYILLPLKIYTEREKFNAGYIELPSLLFPLVFLLPWIKRNLIINILAILTFLHFVMWAFSVQITRYLVPIFPALSVITAYILVDLSDRISLRIGRRVLVAVLVGSMLTVTIIIIYLNFINNRPLPVIAGLESKYAYLMRTEKSYPAQQYIKHNLPAQSKVLLMWDGRSYYCGGRCLPDTDQSRWARLFIEIGPDTSRLAARLHSMGITHLYLSAGDARYIISHDLTAQTQRSVDYFSRSFIPSCANEIYNDTWVMIYTLTCSD